MDTFLWILQIILAIKLLTVTLTHGLQRNKPTILEASSQLGRSARGLLSLAAGVSLLSALGLILPGLRSTSTLLVPLSASLSAISLLISLFFHLRSCTQPKVFVSLVLAAFAVIIAIGRWTM